MAAVLWIGFPASRAANATDPALPAVASIQILAPKAGARFTAPATVVFEAVAVDPLGDIRHLDFYAGDKLVGSSDFLLKIGVIPGNPIPHRFEWKEVPAGLHKVTARGRDTAGKTVASEPVAIEVSGGVVSGLPLIQAGSAWRWRFDAASVGTAWHAPGFDDSKWAVGRAELGFGDGDEKTVISSGRAPLPVTAYFRQEFQVPADLAVGQLQLRLLRDDGAVVYLNGREIVRDNMPDGVVGPMTLARSTSEGGEFHAFTLKPTGLLAGRNVLAVEVHQASASSSDLSFDLALSVVPGPEVTLPTVAIEATRPATSEPAPNIRVAPGLFTVSRTGSTARELIVGLAYSGTATAGDDYAKLPATVVIPAGKNSVGLEVVAVDDDRDEDTETVVATLSPVGEPNPLALVLPTYRIDSNRASARVTIADTDEPVKPPTGASVTLKSPADGTVFPAGRTITLEAVAIDPKGYISRVTFHDGGERIGVSEITFIRAPEPGTPIQHTFEWKGATPGRHSITVRAVDASGAEVVSPPVHVIVGDDPGNGQVHLDVVAAVAEATEPSARVETKAGVFLIRRVAGRTDIPVYVSYALEGEASNGVDYARLSGEATLPAGKKEIEIPVRPLADSLREGDEKVVLALRAIPCIAIFPPPPECYVISGPGHAVVVIHDTPTTNAAPRVALISPAQGSVVPRGEPIRVRAEASDPDGTIAKLEILADGQVLQGGTTSPLEFSWTDASRGTHRLTARAVDNLGLESVSSAVTLNVRDPADLAFVKRDLPPAYLPGGGFDVVLVALPPRSALAWTVEDAAPTGWTATVTGDDAGVDPATGRVRFGPFTDARERRLTYRVTPITGATGSQKFVGTSSLDGRTLPVAGEDTVEPAGERHPADASPSDGVLSADEVTAYAGAWKAGRGWGSDGGTIPAAYVARAGQIWRQGGRYVFVPTQGAPPECWVPGTSGPRALAAIGQNPESAVAVRALPAVWTPGKEGTVSLRVTPASGSEAVCAEETVPDGWRVTRVSEGGTWDPATRRVRWGILFGDVGRSLDYDVVPPGDAASNGAFAGEVAVDGRVVPVGGASVAGASSEATALRMAAPRRAQDGRIRFRVEAVPDQVFVVEGSSDLRDWEEVGAFVHTGDELELDDPKHRVAGARYYRLRPVGR